MTKLILSLATLFLCTISMTNAQTLSIGPVVGVNYSTISKIDNPESRLGLSAGAFANYSINEHFGLNVKLLYSQLGTKVENTTENVRLNYIQVPITGVYFFGEAGNVIRPKVFLGPYVGFLMSAKDKNGNDIVAANGGDYFKKVDIGGLLGAGFNYRIKSRTWLNVDASYSGSFSDITDVTNVGYKNSAISLLVGVSFPIDGTK